MAGARVEQALSGSSGLMQEVLSRILRLRKGCAGTNGPGDPMSRTPLVAFLSSVYVPLPLVPDGGEQIANVSRRRLSRASFANRNAPLFNLQSVPAIQRQRFNEGHDPYASASASSGARSTYVRQYLLRRKRTWGLVSVQRSLNESWDRTRDKVYGVNLGGCRRRGAAATRYVWRDVWLTRWARQVIWGARVKACPPALATISNGAGGARLCALGDAQTGPRCVGLLGTQLVGLLRPAFSTLGAV
ncbi:hypothetical protein C8J57DRAFT_1473977 [Mycena rebaudengoi]|nr:hypothetical protein C8J57DRAFT_1473977 [Mycena rebaudengoi]